MELISGSSFAKVPLPVPQTLSPNPMKQTYQTTNDQPVEVDFDQVQLLGRDLNDTTLVILKDNTRFRIKAKYDDVKPNLPAS